MAITNDKEILEELLRHPISSVPRFGEFANGKSDECSFLSRASCERVLQEGSLHWDQESFVAAGFPAMIYDELKYIAHDEEGHVVYLEAGLTATGATPVAACECSFPMSTPKEFISLASVIEGVRVSAYLGAAPLITDKAYLTAAGAILVTEALHQSATRGAVGEIPIANVFSTPISINATYSIASAFITSCPSTNMPLPVATYPALTLASGSPTAPSAMIDLEPKTMPSLLCYVFPEMASGQGYVFLTSDNSGNLTDSSILAGPAILEVTPSSPTFDLTTTK
ncbi:related to stress response protein rds1p [Phialocephala subalpina]|uniref:Related to stress response protein rds1p n=1 Tax=Phialocephala subalpina TaxID=576137 RepID=A0A1L7XVD9_9HELO|nr:related to stress response protein rds1p [Phialocephala subalpina]